MPAYEWKNLQVNWRGQCPASSFVAALYPSFSLCYSHSLNDLNSIRCMTSITILCGVIVRLYYCSTRTPDIEPAISIRRFDRPPSPNLLPTTLPSIANSLFVSIQSLLQTQLYANLDRSRQGVSIVECWVGSPSLDCSHIHWEHE